MSTNTTLENRIHRESEWSNIVRIIQVPTYVMDKLKILELKDSDSLYPKKNNFPAQRNFENRTLTWFEIEQIEDITLNYNKEIKCSM